MATGPQQEKTSDDAPTPASTSAESTNMQSDANSTSTVVSPAPPVVEPPASFVRLKKYCEDHGLRSTIEVEPELVTIEFRNGRLTRTAIVGTDEAAEALLQYPLEQIIFLGPYSAICSYNEGWIEAAVRSHGSAIRSTFARRTIFGGNPPPGEIDVPGPGGITLRLTEKRGLLYWLDYAAPIYLRISGIEITEHDKAVTLLEDITNSLFMQIDFRFDSPLTLGKDRILVRRSSKSPGRLDEDSQLVFPRFSYEKNPSSLYWYARSATSMPLLQFLAFYQCIEFFFPQYSRRETIAKIKNVLKDPTFDGTKDSDINVILNATLDSRHGSLLEERKQLAATLRQCVEGTTLREFLNDPEERKRYYGSDYKKVSDKKISLVDDTRVVDETAERIYDLRCKIVHTKNAEGVTGGEMILPFSNEADLLVDDVELIKFLARKVLIASSGPLKL